MLISASACGNSVVEDDVGLKEGDMALRLKSPFSASFCDLCSASLCLFSDNLSTDSEAKRRFWGKKKRQCSKQKPL